MRKYLRLTIFCFGLFLLIGCSQSTPQSANIKSTGDVKVFSTVISNYRYNPESVTVNLGDTVRINIKNNDNIQHGISLPAFGVQEFVRPGQTKTIQFLANQKGNPETFCSTDHGEKLLINIV